jgi:hypothetical protein
VQFFGTASPVNIVKKPLSGGGRGESEITNRSLNAKFGLNLEYRPSPVKSSRKFGFFLDNLCLLFHPHHPQTEQ